MIYRHFGAYAVLVIGLGACDATDTGYVSAIENLPPGYVQTQSIDSRGCAYIAPNTAQGSADLNTGRTQICGLSQGGGARPSAAGDITQRQVVVVDIPDGYRLPFKDGRLNPYRGLQ